MNECGMAGLIQRFSTRISIVWYGCYDVKSAMVFRMPGVSLARRGRHNGMTRRAKFSALL
jgi:hypothetical protein